jgi:hypothetical protein
MTEAEILILMQHLDEGHKVLIEGSGFLDSFVNDIRAGDPDEGEAEWVYDSHVFTGKNCAKVDSRSVYVSIPVPDWKDYKFPV